MARVSRMLRGNLCASKKRARVTGGDRAYSLFLLFLRTSSMAGMALTVLSAARSAGCSQASAEIWGGTTRGLGMIALESVMPTSVSAANT